MKGRPSTLRRPAAQASTELGGEVRAKSAALGKALKRITSIRDFAEDPMEHLEGSLIYAKEKGGISYALQIGETAKPDGFGVFCDAVYRGSNCDPLGPK